ncbi:MAG: heavy metal translocating P-type ATPase, partial [Chloroflexi bacterium]|nr:heavy metal translocating P-type ATPase [Chloroflexota bacterium]
MLNAEPKKQNTTANLAEERCAEILVDAITQDQRFLSADVDEEKREVHLTYDADKMTARDATQFVRRVSENLHQNYERCTFRTTGMRCGECANALERQLATLPGVPLAAANAASQTVAVTYDPAFISIDSIETRVRELGVSPRPAEGNEDHGPAWWSQERLEPILVVVTLLALIAGVAGQWLAAPEFFVATMGVIAYVAGGYYGVLEGFDSLLKLEINVDLLMVLAAFGAALIGSWPEGATLLFLFSLSNVLQSYAMDRSRQAIRKLLDLRPATALVRRGDQDIEMPVEEIQVAPPVGHVVQIDIR